jgi:hypothetical protein
MNITGETFLEVYSKSEMLGVVGENTLEHGLGIGW